MRFRKLFALLSLPFLMLSCQEHPPVEVLDFYYPLKSIDDYLVYQYDIRWQNDSVSLPGYVAVGRINTDQYYLKTLNEKEELVDSTVIQVTDEAIELVNMYIPNDGRLIKNSDSIQVIYPLSLKFGQRHRTTTTHDNIVDPDLKSIVFANEASLMQDDSISITIRLMSQFLGLRKDGIKDSYTMMDEIILKRGVGMVYMSNRSQYGIEITELIKTYSSKEWMNR